MSPLAWIISQAEGLALATPWQRVQPALPGLIAARDHAAPQPRMGPVIAAQRLRVCVAPALSPPPKDCTAPHHVDEFEWDLQPGPGRDLS